jgi:hypothetical protein
LLVIPIPFPIRDRCRSLLLARDGTCSLSAARPRSHLVVIAYRLARD